MILVDFSAIMHQMIYGSINAVKPKKIDGTFITSEFINVAKSFILNELFNISRRFINYGEMVIALDNSSSWRKRVYAPYKSSRKDSREKSEINYTEVFIEINKLTDTLKEYTPFKVLDVQNAEGDDIILVLAEENGKKGIPTMIISADKDMLQAQKYPCVKQYSPISKKFLSPEQKAEGDVSSDPLEEWIIEHVCLGDESDEIPKITDGTRFSKEFSEHLQTIGLGDMTPLDFEKDLQKQKFSLENYNVHLVSRKGETLGLKIFDNPKIGPKTIKKEIQKFGCLNDWVNSSDILREHFNRNKELILMEYIPENIKGKILSEYGSADNAYHEKEFTEYCRNNNLGALLADLPNNFTNGLSVDSLLEGW